MNKITGRICRSDYRVAWLELYLEPYLLWRSSGITSFGIGNKPILNKFISGECVKIGIQVLLQC